jgi:2,4-dienoyl-CoA reductase-like NADH-dependent reductase (Old Yellow Enzyme family)
MLVDEIREVFSWLVASGKVDLIDMSLWDVFKEAHEPEHAGKQLLELFTSIPRGNVKLAVAGKIATPQDAQKAIDLGADIAALGRGAILHHDFPNKTKADPHFTPRTLPVAAEVLRSEGLSEPFVNYMKSWTGFVSE